MSTSADGSKGPTASAAASATGSGGSSGSTLQSPGAGGFSSAPVAPVMTSRRGNNSSKNHNTAGSSGSGGGGGGGGGGDRHHRWDAWGKDAGEGASRNQEDHNDTEAPSKEPKKPRRAAAPSPRSYRSDDSDDASRTQSERGPNDNDEEDEDEDEDDEGSGDDNGEDDKAMNGAKNKRRQATPKGDDRDAQQQQRQQAQGSSAGGSKSQSASQGPTPPRNASMTLPSLSRAAMMHMNEGRHGPMGDRRGEEPPPMSASGYGRYHRRSRSRSRDRPTSAHSNTSSSRHRTAHSQQQYAQWRGMGPTDKDTERPEDSGGAPRRRRGTAAPTAPENADGGADNGEDDDSEAPHERGGNDGEGEPRPPSDGDLDGGQETRIMFHGREVYADDLIGLRVARTFVGHGRFLGQIVKFDEPTGLYTIVYADGDAEELSIENTIPILIQDEIERADPSLPPVAASFRPHERLAVPDSPEGSASNVTPPATATAAVVPAQHIPSHSHGHGHHGLSHNNSSAGASAASVATGPRPSGLSISDREAQFVIGLFENHALPILLHQGWRVQSNAAGTEHRFHAPPGSFRGAGRVFGSALDVVELIASDNELLSACFPANVHAAILSLFPEQPPAVAAAAPGSRKRSAATLPLPGDVPPSMATEGSTSGPYDPKRQRGAHARDELYGAPGPRAPSTHVRGDERLVSGAPPPPMGPYRPMPSSTEPHRERDHRHRLEADPYGSRMIPGFPGGGGRGSELGPGDYRRGGDYRSLPLRPMASDAGGGGGGPSRRWAQPTSSSALGPGPSGNGTPPEYHRRPAYGDSGEWPPEREPMARGGGGGYPPGRPMMGGHREDHPGYYAERGATRGGGAIPSHHRSAMAAAATADPYRYRELKAAAAAAAAAGAGGGSGGGGVPGAGGSYSPGPDPFAHRYHRESPVDPYRGGGPGAAGGPPVPPSSGMHDRFAAPRPLSRGSAPGGPGPGRGGGFSMMDVDRNSRGGGGGEGPGATYDRLERVRGAGANGTTTNSPRGPETMGPAGGGGGPYAPTPPPMSSSAYGHHGLHHHHQRMGSNGGSGGMYGAGPGQDPVRGGGDGPESGGRVGVVDEPRAM